MIVIRTVLKSVKNHSKSHDFLLCNYLQCPYIYYYWQDIYAKNETFRRFSNIHIFRKKKKEPRETLISFAAANAGYIIELFAFHFIVFSALTSIAWL